MSHLRIAGETFHFDRVSLLAYHCASREADWNLGLEGAGTTLWLSGTIVPGPATPDDLDGAQVSVELRSLDEVVEALLGRPITMYPGGQAVCALAFPIARTAAGARFAVDFEFDWDHALGTFPDKAAGTRLTGALELDAELEALHPAGLPRG
jgi:hypothetical protein